MVKPTKQQAILFQFVFQFSAATWAVECEACPQHRQLAAQALDVVGRQHTRTTCRPTLPTIHFTRNV